MSKSKKHSPEQSEDQEDSIIGQVPDENQCEVLNPLIYPLLKEESEEASIKNNLAIKEFLAELDTCIEREISVDVFQLPLDYIEDLNVEPIASTYHEGEMHYLLRVNQREMDACFIRVSTSDGGVMSGYSDVQPANRDGKLLMESEEGWTFY